MDFFNSRYFIFNKIMLNIMGLWPYQSSKQKYSIRCVYSLFMCLALIPQIISFQFWKGNDPDKLILCITTLSYLIGVTLKLASVIATNRKLQTVFEKIAENWKMITDKDEIRILSEYSEVGRLLTLSYVLYMLAAVVVFISMPCLPVVVDIFFTINGSQSRFYVLNGEYNVDKVEYYNRIYLFESLCSIATVPIFCTVDSTYAVCVEQCVALLAVVRFRLKVATQCLNKDLHSEDEDIAYTMIVKAADLHKDVIDFAQILNSSYSMSLLLIMGMNLPTISIGALVILANLKNPFELARYSMIFIALMIHMLYLSWPGQELINSSGKITYDAYNNEWYYCSLKNQKLLKFIMLRAIKPLEMTVGGILVLNIENFGLLAKTSISYVAVFASLK